MAPRLLVPGRRPLLLPGTDRRAVRRPNGAGLIVPHQSAAPLSPFEVDYDDLEIVRQWREYSPDDPDEVRYFCYELDQLHPGAKTAEHYFKAVRLIRLTRVPRYLRQQPSNEQFRDLLAGLREKHVVFLNIVAKSPQLPLVFAYGVQGIGSTIEEATESADDAYAALTFSLDGTYQQLEYQPLNVSEGELLARYQSEWRHIAMARGRPLPDNSGLGASSVLDGNRTDLQQTNDAISSFVRGMGDKSFMLSLVTVPLTPEDMSVAWRNIGKTLNAVRSDQQGSRSIGASFAIPLGLGTALADGSGTTHGITGTSGIGSSDGLSATTTDTVSVSHTDGVSASQTQGTSVSQTEGVSVSHTEGLSTSFSEGQSEGQSVSASDSLSHSITDSTGQSTSVGESVTQGESMSASQGMTDSMSVSQSTGLTDTRSFSDTAGISQGQSLGMTNSASSNWSTSVGQGLSAGQTLSDSWSQSFADTMSQTWGLSESRTDGTNRGAAEGGNAQLGGGFEGLGLSATLGENWQNSWGANFGLVTGSSLSQSGGATSTAGVGSSLANSLTNSLNIGESAGGALGQSVTGTNSVGESRSVTAGQSLGVSQAQSVGQGSSLTSTAGIASTLAHGASLSQGMSTGTALSSAAGQVLGSSASAGTSASSSVAASSAATTGASQSATVGASQSATQGVSASDTVGASLANTQGASTGISSQQAMSNAWMVAMSRQASQSGSFGIMPGVNATISKATFDESKRALGDILEAQMNRYLDGVEGGGWLYQMFLVTQDKSTLSGAAALLKAAFWGPGGKDKGRLVAPFHTVLIENDDEADRLLTHAAAFTHDRKREPVSEFIEPHLYSSYVTAGEAAVFAAPPTAESLGLMAQVDSMPVFAMPSDRANRDMYLGNIINGERGRVSDALFGVDLDELTHILVQGITGMGKTSTVMRLLEQAVALRRDLVIPPTAANPVVTTRVARAGALCLDWMNNMRDLANIVEPERFQLFSVSQPELGAFRWNPLEIPHPDMAAHQWLGAQADQLAASFGLGEAGRSLIAEHIDTLYTANRLEPFTLRERKTDPDTGVILRSELILPPIPRSDLPPEAIVLDDAGNEVANVYTYAPLSRLVSLEHLATLIVGLVEELATPEGARAMGTSMRDRVQSLWRRIQYYAPGGPWAAMVAADPDLNTRECLGVQDIIDPDRGLVTVIETDGLDQGVRRVVLGSVMLAVYRYGLHVGKGAFDNGGRGPGTFLILEEAHELFGSTQEGEDRDSVNMRVTLYESMFRRARATGLRLVAMTQNCGSIPSAITSQTTTVIVHRTMSKEDRSSVCDLFSWDRSMAGQMREIRYLGEMPIGHALVRLNAHKSYLESAPVHILVDPPDIPAVSDEQLTQLSRTRTDRLSAPVDQSPGPGAQAPAWANVSPRVG